jgi:hypothetical protein
LRTILAARVRLRRTVSFAVGRHGTRRGKGDSTQRDYARGGRLGERPASKTNARGCCCRVAGARLDNGGNSPIDT